MPYNNDTENDADNLEINVLRQRIAKLDDLLLIYHVELRQLKAGVLTVSRDARRRGLISVSNMLMKLITGN